MITINHINGRGRAIGRCGCVYDRTLTSEKWSLTCWFSLKIFISPASDRLDKLGKRNIKYNLRITQLANYAGYVRKSRLCMSWKWSVRPAVRDFWLHWTTREACLGKISTIPVHGIIFDFRWLINRALNVTHCRYYRVFLEIYLLKTPLSNHLGIFSQLLLWNSLYNYQFSYCAPTMTIYSKFVNRHLWGQFCGKIFY